MASRPSAARPPEATLSRLPPLTALRAFTATARHLSFVRAAEELHVTPAAVGQHIRQLESHFGQPLFLRNRGQLELTEAGRALFPGLRQAFETVLAAVSRLGDPASEGVLRIAAPAAFISRWLMPRLASLGAALPETRIVFETAVDAAVSADGRVDCVVRRARECPPGQGGDYLFEEELVPVCTPAYRMRFALQAEDCALARVTLLDEVHPDQDGRYPGWETWVRVNDLDQPLPARRLGFADPGLVIEAALAGQGLALASLRLAQHDLAAGRLVVPFGAPIPVRDAYFLQLCTPSAGSAAGAFRHWLLREAAISRARSAEDAGFSAWPEILAAE